MNGEIRVTNLEQTDKFVEKEIPMVSFSDGSKGFYVLDDVHKVRIWIRINPHGDVESNEVSSK